MKNVLVFILCCAMFSAAAQQQYQSLLWKISGNGLKKESYLYGTMHISSKVAYRLDDVFYEALLNAETIALESDPGTWLEYSYEDINAAMDSYRFYTEGFYPELFKLEPARETTVREAVRLDNDIINAYLYRKDYDTDNFEEETYLDMFIYQAGHKNKKTVVALEDLEASRYLTTKAAMDPEKKNPDAWIQKRLEKEDLFLLQENAYRDRNLDLLDSIGMALNSQVFREYMLYKRNENMVNALDSLLKKTTVFAGVGAAHLPGEKGMINMLRNKGYTVSPLTSKQTRYARIQKETLEKTFVATPLAPESTPDGFITLNSFGKLYELPFMEQKFYLALDIANGAYLAVNRISTYDYLSGNETIDLDKIDNMLYEDIPGTIVKKERITAPFPGISILNKTKKGDYQQYHIYRTPLEIVIIKLGGKLDYVLNNAENIFSSVTFRPVSNDWQTLKAASGKYQMLIPSNYSIENYTNSGKKIIQSYHDNEYFFFQEVPVYDVNYIEDDAFEAAYLHDSFYKNHELKKEEGNNVASGYYSYSSSAVSPVSEARKIQLKTIVKDDSYYMLGYEGDDPANAEAFFSSFRFDTPEEGPFETVRDTSLHFSVVSNTKPGLPGLIRAMTSGNRGKPYEERVKETVYTTAYNEQIMVRRTKFHDLQMYASADSLWAEIDDNYEDFIISNRQKSVSGNTYTYALRLKDPESVKYIRVKNILKKGVLFELKCVEDSLSAPSEFVSRFYETFTPADTLPGQDVFADKTQRFLDAVKRNDSIVLKSYRHVRFSEKNTDRIIDVLSNHDFPEDRSFIKRHLIITLGRMKSDKVSRYLASLYTRSYADPQTQTAILKVFLNKNNESAYRRFLELLERDFPLDASGVRTLFPEKDKALKLKKSLFPELLGYVTIEEYKEPVYALLATLKDSGHIKAKSYKKYKNQILNDAKVEVKRNIGKRKNRFSRKDDPLLGHYVTLLFPFRNEKKTALFFSNLLNSDDRNALTTYYVLLKGAGEMIPQELVEKTLENQENRYMLAEKLSQSNLLAAEKRIDQEAYARSKVLEKERYDAVNDSISLLRKSELHIAGKKTPVDVYCYILKQQNRGSSDSLLYYIAFERKDGVNVNPYFTGNSSGIYIRPTKTTDEYIEEALDAVRHKTRKRTRLKDNRYRY